LVDERDRSTGIAGIGSGEKGAGVLMIVGGCGVCHEFEWRSGLAVRQAEH